MVEECCDLWSTCVFVADSQDVDLDAILGELCALEQRCENDLAATPNSDNQRPNRPTNGRITAGENDIGKTEGILYISITFFIEIFKIHEFL